jgi:hypothetical protein
MTVNVRDIVAGAVLAICACAPGWAADSAIPMPSAANTERSSPPDACSEREVNCVINDGPPPRAPWVHPRPAVPGTAAPAASAASSGNASVTAQPATAARR